MGNVLTSYSWTKGGRQHICAHHVFGHVHLLSSGVDGHWQVLHATRSLQRLLSLVAKRYLDMIGSKQDHSKLSLLIDLNIFKNLKASMEVSRHVTDVTNLTHTAPSNGTALAGFIWTRAGEEHLVYIDDLRHVVDLFTTPGEAGRYRSLDNRQSAFSKW